MEQRSAVARGAEGDVYFDHAPVPLWLEDLSEVRVWLAGLREAGVTDLTAHFRRHPRAVAECLSRVRVLDVNQAAVRLYRAPGREALLAGLGRVVRPHELWRPLARLLERLEAGRTAAEAQALQRTWEGEPLRVTVSLSLLPEGRADWSRALVSVQDVTPLARMRDRLRALHEATPDAVIVHDPTGRIVEANEAAARIFACAREALMGSTLERWTEGRAAEALRAALRRAEGGEPVDAEWTALGCDGRAFPVEARLRPLAALGPSGRAPVLCVLRDIGERRRAEAALRESEAKFRDLAEKALVGVYLIQDGVLKYANPRLAQIFGYPLDELVERVPVAQLVDPEDRALVAENLRRRLEGETEALHYRFRGRRRDGRRIHVEVYGARTVFQGRPAVLGTLVDATDRMEAEARETRLREGLLRLDEWSRRLLAARGDETRFRHLVCEGAREVLAAGLVALTALGDDRRLRYLEAVGERAGLLHGMEVGLEEAGLCGWVVRTGRAVRVDDLATDPRARPDLATSLGMRAALVVPLLSEGRVVGGVSAFRERPFDDIDERLLSLYAGQVAAALENLRLLQTLELRVARRTAQLEAANRELESFAYSVSHDLRAPLRAIDGFARAVLEDCADRLPPEGRAYLERVRGAAQRMGRLIDDLLALSRVIRREMRRERVDLTGLARQVLAELAEREPGRTVATVVEPGLEAEADPGLVRVLLENLLGNAWKYTRPCAEARIEVGREPVPPGRAPVFYVRDNGVGFDMRYAERLFTPFQRLHRDDEFEGTGIGLATVQRIVLRHGGRIWAEGAPGEGAVFRFTLGPDGPARGGFGALPPGGAAPPGGA